MELKKYMKKNSKHSRAHQENTDKTVHRSYKSRLKFRP